VLSIIRGCRRAAVRYLIVTRIRETGDQASGNDRPLLARLSHSAYGSFLVFSARTGLIGKVRNWSSLCENSSAF
jgi:hypothetical protein